MERDEDILNVEGAILRVEEVVDESGPGGAGMPASGFPEATGTPGTVVREDPEWGEGSEEVDSDLGPSLVG